ncbi:MAG TPA: CoA transferase, partial [Marmoricola sp.]
MTEPLLSDLSQALRGVRVVSVAVNLPGPVVVWRLAALGASAVKIEPPAGDPLAAAARGWYV